jgi:hypothetical protein
LLTLIGGAKYLFFRPIQIATNAVSNPMNQKPSKRYDDDGDDYSDSEDDDDDNDNDA